MFSFLCTRGVEKIFRIFRWVFHYVTANLFTYFDVVRIWRKTEHMDCGSLLGTSIEMWYILFFRPRIWPLLLAAANDYIIFYAYRVIYYYYYWELFWFILWALGGYKLHDSISISVLMLLVIQNQIFLLFIWSIYIARGIGPVANTWHMIGER